MNYKTPGVYVKEISLFPPSVAQVATAIPAFIGYTKSGSAEPVRITSLLEYEQQFGGPHAQSFEVTLDDEEPYLPQDVSYHNGESPYLMYPALQMFFANGGGACYIVSTGNYEGESGLDSLSDYTELEKGVDKIRKVDEVTLIVIPEAIRLLPNEQYDLYKHILMQCGDLKDRFGIFDLRSDDTNGSDFRDDIGTTYLSYGAAYFPYLNTTLSHYYDKTGITLAHSTTDAFDGVTLDDVETLSKGLVSQSRLEAAKTIVEEAKADAQSGSVKKSELLKLLSEALSNVNLAITMAENALDLIADSSFTTTDLDTAKSTRDDVKALNLNSSNTNVEIKDGISDLETAVDNANTAMDAIISELNSQTGIAASNNEDIETYFTNSFSAELSRLLNEKRIPMPPSAAIAGIYAKTDADRGVWKSPANISLNQVSGPAVKLTMAENADFNVHPTGKSINVIRAFTGKGTLVWGARTLDGNSNEWRYIAVRRFFNMVEESVKKSTEPFVFESNDANTWLKVKAMIENYLVLQWRAGALMGAKPEEAFFVKVGLGETMTQEDVLKGEMIVETGMAVVRPAEFIILRFSHKMLES